MAITYAVYRIYFIDAHIDSYGDNSTLPSNSQQKVGLEADVDRFTELLSWSVTGAVFMLSFIGCVSVLLYTLRATSTLLPVQKRVWLIVSLIAVLVGASWASFGDSPFAVDSLNPLILSSLGQLDLRMGVLLFNAFTPMMLAITALMVFCSIATLMLQADNDASAGKLLRVQFQYMNVILFGGAIVLVSGIVHANAVHHLPDVFLSESDLEAWRKLVANLSTSAGAIWTLILIGLYLPAIAMLRLRAHAVANRVVDREEFESTNHWLTSHGLTFQLPQRLAQFGALISPFVVGGPASPLLGLLGS